MQPDPASPRSPSSKGEAHHLSLTQTIADLSSASVAELRAAFRQLYKKAAPDSLSRDLIARLVAHRLQERRLGYLDRELAAQLDRFALGQSPGRRLKAGTVLVREHEGTMHEVVILPGGYLWNGRTFNSLSTVARQITGTNWNGPRFFGLRMPARQSVSTATSADG